MKTGLRSTFQVMNLLSPNRRFDPDSPELIDRADTDRASLKEELETLGHLNQRCGGHDMVIQHLEHHWPKANGTVQLLDLGTGVADVPRAIVAWARRHKLQAAVTAVDVNPRVLEIAAEASRDWPEITLAQHDLRSLPYPGRSFDFVLCSRTLHHFDNAQATAILRRINEISRVAYLVNDLRRNWPSIWAVDWLFPLLVRSRAFIQDARQSCRAAFTLGELRAMAHAAGLESFQLRRHQAMFCAVLSGRK